MDEVATGYGLVEAPVWAQGRGLFFSDVLGGGVFRLGLEGCTSTSTRLRPTLLCIRWEETCAT